jgi:hypothetical protein
MSVAPYGSIGERLRRLHAIEISLALSVILGLLFVSLRIMTMSFPTTAGAQSTVAAGTLMAPVTLQASDYKGP